MAFTPSGLRSVGVSRLRGVRGSSVFTLLTAHLGCWLETGAYGPKTADVGFAFPQMWCAWRCGRVAVRVVGLCSIRSAPARPNRRHPVTLGSSLEGRPAILIDVGAQASVLGRIGEEVYVSAKD